VIEYLRDQLTEAWLTSLVPMERATTEANS